MVEAYGSREQFRRLMARLGWDTDHAARELGRDRRLVQRWGSGARAVPPEVMAELRRRVEAHEARAREAAAGMADLIEGLERDMGD